MNRKPLGVIELPNRTIDFDLTLLQRYQEFSAELLRLSLIGISAIGFAISMLFKDAVTAGPMAIIIKAPTANQSCWIQGLLIAALGALATSAASSLMHRYLSTDAMACQLRALRLHGRYVDDLGEAKRETAERKWRLEWSRTALAVAAAALAVGAISLVIAMAIVIWPK